MIQLRLFYIVDEANKPIGKTVPGPWKHRDFCMALTSLYSDLSNSSILSLIPKRH
jgi:hypothetical protein